MTSANEKLLASHFRRFKAVGDSFCMQQPRRVQGFVAPVTRRVDEDHANRATVQCGLSPMPTRNVSDDLSRDALGLTGLTTRNVSLNNCTSWV